jgi:hypothetical protein
MQKRREGANLCLLATRFASLTPYSEAKWLRD